MTSPQKVLPFSEPLLFSCPVIVVHLNCWPHSYTAPTTAGGTAPLVCIRTRAEIRMKWMQSPENHLGPYPKTVNEWALRLKLFFSDNMKIKGWTRDEGCITCTRLFFSLFLALHQSIAFFLSGHRSISFQTWIWTLITVAMLDISKLSGQSDWQPNWNTDI